MKRTRYEPNETQRTALRLMRENGYERYGVNGVSISMTQVSHSTAYAEIVLAAFRRDYAAVELSVNF